MRRRQLLEFAVLGLLHESPMHGYELRRRLNAALGVFRALSFGTLYPCLKHLLSRGLIAEDSEAPSPGKRPRITYALTDAGRDEFARMVASSDPGAWEDEGFDVRVAFFSRTSRDVRLRILEGRRSRLEERLEVMRESSIRTRERMDTWTAALQRHGEESTEREVRWLTELIDAEHRSADPPASPTEPGDTPSHTRSPRTQGERP